MNGWEWGIIVIAAFWGVLVIALVFALAAVFRLINEIGQLVHGVTEQTVPLLGGLNETVAGVNVELARVDSIVAGVQSITATTDQLVAVVHATVSNPLIKAAAWMTGAAAAAKSAKALKDEM
ncbi:MAG: DUF948 domain-containing protein [Nitriliruptorales bacterium]|nr:DUF948 domain-containing protein [Nitriliruptorales bacterium]